jgi:hypothetical protein
MNGTTRNRRVWAGFKGITERGLAPGTGARLLTARGFFLNRLPPMSLARLAAGATRRGDRNHAPVTFAARTVEFILRQRRHNDARANRVNPRTAFAPPDRFGHHAQRITALCFDTY